MSGHQQTIYTIHESQLNNGGGGGQRNSNSDILIDTSSIPMTQQPMPPMQHHHLQPQQQQQQFDSNTITSQPINSNASGSSRVAPENQNVVYSVHPIFNMLDNHDTLLIRQKADCTSTCCCFESVNTYTVRTKDGSPILKAIENSNCCDRCCFENNRGYSLSLVSGDEVVARIRKPYRVSRFCCYSNAVRIESPEDNPVGQIKQMFTLFGHPRYAIYDCHQPPKTPSFYIESTSCRFCFTPCLCTCICGNKEFRIISTETKEEVGTISRHWSSSKSSGGSGDESGVAETVAGSEGSNGGGGGADVDEAIGEEQFNNSNNNNIARQKHLSSDGSQVFGVQFSNNLEARQKVLLLSACFMMDFFYFENDRRRRKLTSC